MQYLGNIVSSSHYVNSESVVTMTFVRFIKPERVPEGSRGSPLRREGNGPDNARPRYYLL